MNIEEKKGNALAVFHTAGIKKDINYERKKRCREADAEVRDWNRFTSFSILGVGNFFDKPFIKSEWKPGVGPTEMLKHPRHVLSEYKVFSKRHQNYAWRDFRERPVFS